MRLTIFVSLIVILVSCFRRIMDQTVDFRIVVNYVG